MKTPGTPRNALRRLAAALSMTTLCYGGWQVWTALALSVGAPLGWRLQLVLLEGGIPTLLALGFALAAARAPRTRRIGWVAVVAVLLGGWYWVSRVVVPPTGAVSIGHPHACVA